MAKSRKIGRYLKNWKQIYQHLKVSIHKYTLNMDTRCGIRKTIEFWIYLEKLKNQKDGIILLESNTPAFESVQLQVWKSN